MKMGIISALTLAAALFAASCSTGEKTYDLPEVYKEDGTTPGGVTPGEVEAPHVVRARKDNNSSWGEYEAVTIDRMESGPA